MTDEAESLEKIPQPAWRCDEFGQTVECNRRWYEYTGQTPEQARGFGWMQAVHPDDRTQVLELMFRRLRSASAKPPTACGAPRTAVTIGTWPNRARVMATTAKSAVGSAVPSRSNMRRRPKGRWERPKTPRYRPACKLLGLSTGHPSSAAAFPVIPSGPRSDDAAARDPSSAISPGVSQYCHVSYARQQLKNTPRVLVVDLGADKVQKPELGQPLEMS